LTTTAELPDEPVWVDGDAVRLEEILWSLMSNAVRHTPRGGTIAVDVTPHDDTVVIVVRDTGSGLEHREIRRIFRAFVHGDCATADGLGLGLALAWDLARSHGGTIDVRSDDRRWRSEFRAVLPSSV
jgi:signal transduction histidine kinase